jgi:hypothetical protein
VKVNVADTKIGELVYEVGLNAIRNDKLAGTERVTRWAGGCGDSFVHKHILVANLPDRFCQRIPINGGGNVILRDDVQLPVGTGINVRVQILDEPRLVNAYMLVDDVTGHCA